MTDTTIHVLLCYRYEDQSLDFEQFSDTEEATRAYAAKEAEMANGSSSSEYEVVLVGADSLDTIMKTHGHYFAKAADRASMSLFSEFLSDPTAA